MKLGEIRNQLNAYDQDWMLRRLAVGDHQPVREIKKFLHAYQNKDDAYEFTGNDLYSLLPLININSNLSLILKLKSQFSSNYLLKIYDKLKEAHLLNPSIFNLVYAANHDSRCFIRNILENNPEAPLAISTDLLTFALEQARIHGDSYTLDMLEKILRIAGSKYLISKSFLKYLADNNRELLNILATLNVFLNANILNSETLTCIMELNSSSLYDFNKFVTIILNCGIKIDNDLCMKARGKELLGCFNEFLSILLTEANPIVIDKQLILQLLDKNFVFFFDCIQLLTLLHQASLLDQKAFDFICRNDTFLIYGILSKLSENNLIKNNHDLLDKLFTHHHIYNLRSLINYMDKCGIINITSLDTAISITNQIKNDMFAITIMDLISQLETADFLLTENEFTQLASLSPNNLKRINSLIDSLSAKRLLNHDAFSAVINRISEKIPAPAESKARMHVNNNLDKSIYSITLNEGTSIYINRLELGTEGGYGIVKKGYSAPAVNSPVFAIKKIIQDKPGFDPVNVARREAKYNKLLGRNSFFYHNKSGYFIVYDWQKGKSAASLSRQDMLRIPMLNRLVALTHGISEINTLHQHYRIHGDIKSDNFILDTNTNKLKLIDFGSCHKKGSSKSFEFTECYADPIVQGDDFCRDIYSLGIVVAELFPELFAVTFNPHASINQIKLFCTPLETAILRLVVCMMHPIPSDRCTSNDAMIFCNYLVKNHKSLDMLSVDMAAMNTINHDITTLEDVLRNAPKWG